MNITFSFVAHSFNDVLKERMMPTFSSIQKKIIFIAAALFASVAAYYVLRSYCWKVKSLTVQKTTYLSYDEVMQKARKDFKYYPNSQAIITRIETRLQDIGYANMIKNGKMPSICLNWEDTLWGPGIDDLSIDEKLIISSASGFLQSIPGVLITILK